jgi:hypothetical protein
MEDADATSAAMHIFVSVSTDAAIAAFAMKHPLEIRPQLAFSAIRSAKLNIAVIASEPKRPLETAYSTPHMIAYIGLVIAVKTLGSTRFAMANPTAMVLFTALHPNLMIPSISRA